MLSRLPLWTPLQKPAAEPGPHPECPQVRALGVWGSGLCAIAALSRAERRVLRCPLLPRGWPMGSASWSRGCPLAGMVLASVSLTVLTVDHSLRKTPWPGHPLPPAFSLPVLAWPPQSLPSPPMTLQGGRAHNRPDSRLLPRGHPMGQLPCLFCPLTGVEALQHLAGGVRSQGKSQPSSGAARGMS